MTGKNLFRALSFVDEDLVAEAENETPRRVIPMKTVRWAGALAACLCVLVCWAVAVQLPEMGSGGSALAGGGVMEDAAANEAKPEAGKESSAAAETAEDVTEDSGEKELGFIPQLEPLRVEKITITSQPESETYARVYTDREKIEKVVTYINELDLKADFPEDPDTYCGMAYVITIELDDGSVREFMHFGNLFFKETDGAWFKMKYKQAEALDELVRNTPSD